MYSAIRTINTILRQQVRIHLLLDVVPADGRGPKRGDASAVRGRGDGLERREIAPIHTHVHIRTLTILLFYMTTRTIFCALVGCCAALLSVYISPRLPKWGSAETRLSASYYNSSNAY